jgi:hypothetical protein
MDLQRREIELVEIVLRFFFTAAANCSSCSAKFPSRRQPACDNVKGGSV